LDWRARSQPAQELRHLAGIAERTQRVASFADFLTKHRHRAHHQLDIVKQHVLWSSVNERAVCIKEARISVIVRKVGASDTPRVASPSRRNSATSAALTGIRVLDDLQLGQVLRLVTEQLDRCTEALNKTVHIDGVCYVDADVSRQQVGNDPAERIRFLFGTSRRRIRSKLQPSLMRCSLSPSWP